MGVDDNFELLLQEKKHKELMAKLDTVLSTLKELKIEMPTIDLSGVEAAVSKITIKEEVQAIPAALQAMVSKIGELKTEETGQWTFKVERNADGAISSVVAIKQ